MQYNAVLAITGAIRASSREKVYELGLKTFESRICLRRFCCFCKIIFSEIPAYLAELISSVSTLYNTRNTRNIATYCCITDAFRCFFFLRIIGAWNKLYFNIRASSFNISRTNLIKIIRPIQHLPFTIY